MKQALTLRALQYACNRVEGFALVQSAREVDERSESIDVWLDSLGFDESLRVEFARWVDRFVGPGWDGAILIGFIAGLFVAQYNEENPDVGSE